MNTNTNNFPKKLKSQIDIAMQDKPVVLINGPRQSGKTTLVKEYSPALPYYTLDDDNILNEVKQDPVGFVSRIDKAFNCSTELLEQKRILDLDNYSVIELQNDKIGKLPASIYWNSNDIPQDGQKINIFDNYKLLDIFDALIYLGSRRSLQWSNRNTDNFDDQALQELNRRKNIA